MSDESVQPGMSEDMGTGGPADRLSPQEFALRLQESRRVVWTIAAAILHDSSQADDVVQDAAAIALGKLGDFDPATSFTAWFGQIVRFVALNETRRRRRHPTSGPDALDGAPARRADGASPFDRRVDAALATLSDVARTCLVLRTVHGLSFAQIAEALDLPEGTAMSHVHRARAVLRERLASNAEEGGSP
ncbi:MAG: RNA polymerase sigma factor [Planctomycetota bacterium]|nr:RNA polymerase sigma factor [Planctomycetota bacterium]